VKKTSEPKPTNPTITRKLRLTRATVRPLTTAELTAVAGGLRGTQKGSKAEEVECQTV
jgi:hypothetical protein